MVVRLAGRLAAGRTEAKRVPNKAWTRAARIHQALAHGGFLVGAACAGGLRSRALKLLARLNAGFLGLDLIEAHQPCKQLAVPCSLICHILPPPDANGGQPSGRPRHAVPQTNLVRPVTEE